MLKVSIITSGKGASAALALPPLLASKKIQLLGVLRIEGDNPATSQRRRWRRLKKFFRIGPLGALCARRLRAWYGEGGLDIEQACRKAGLPLVTAAYASSPEALTQMRTWASDVALSLGNGFLPQRLYSLPRLGTINLHHEILPDYRNGRSVIWPIYFGRKETGFTFHQVTDGIDAGAILYQERLPIIFAERLDETVRQSFAAVRARAAAALPALLEDLENRLAQRQPQGQGGSFITPTFWQLRRMAKNNRRLWQESQTRGENQGA